ncbi:MAG: phosphotransferase family protein, partial [Acidobacteria bacterium]|nr:phosphotransferase family protein [Acidobacteriota bacterium]
MTGDTQPVRAAEQLDWTTLESWLRARLPACGIAGLDLDQALRVDQFPGGHSNLTYHVRFGKTELVLRRPPLGPVPPTAHDMAREFRWLSAVHPVFPLAPRAYLLCDDLSVVGSVFYVMERRHGIVVRHEEPPVIDNRPDVRRRVGRAVVDALVELHAVDIEPAGLMHLGKPVGFVERQVRGWSDRWQRAKTVEIPEMEMLAAWLSVQLPAPPSRPAIVHGDFKLDNLMLAADNPARLVAVFDWEMSALGDPLVDLGILLAYWVPNAPPEQRDALTTVTALPGWFTRDELVERYATRSGADMSTLRYFEVFALFKIAVVIQQIFFRYVKGQTNDPRFARFGDRVTYLARQA